MALPGRPADRDLPAAIKSAIMTSADVVDRSGNMIVNEQHVSADFFAIGAGHVNPNKASDPGLVYDLSADDYIPYLCGLGYTSGQVTVITRRTIDCSSVKSIAESQLNYPSITVSLTPTSSSIAVRRTVRNVGEAASVYAAEVDLSDRLGGMVVPSKLYFTEVNEEKSFLVIISKRANINSGEVLQGCLKWVSETRVVRSPISVSFMD
uniref:Subtilisin-like protease fibronectin type-III domain-containing protein n=1 Tax=Ananas comosus var. bracteatus TaxID=296719 RepID=A0A6V7QPI7_ANACO|nr:unnamed protein product [Ananas comosus var. bracteatus]